MTSKRAKKVDPQEHLSMEWDPPVAPLRIVRKFGLWLVVRVEERGTFYKTRKEARAALKLSRYRPLRPWGNGKEGEG